MRPVLEYASCVWDPYTTKEKTKIEKIQRRAARFVTKNYKKKESVTAMLKKLKWQSLEDRRKKARLFALDQNIISAQTTDTFSARLSRSL